MDKPIPAFYACYLLRSTIRHASLYVGSTPNPARRLRQHNGNTQGGAARTSRESLRPWEMTCLVTGFPSKIAALQFEWAWQNTHLTRHVSPSSRLTQARMTVRYSPRTGRPRKRAERPRQSLSDRLSNLHLLLRADSFERWPLKVTFYAADIYRVWQMCAKHQDSALRAGVDAGLDESCGEPVTDTASVTSAVPISRGIHGVDVGYSALKPHLERSTSILTQPYVGCRVCNEPVPKDGSQTLTCPNTECTTATHMHCLANLFLQNEGNTSNVLPLSGQCPGCDTRLYWSDLVKELSLRMRAPEQVRKLFKVRGRAGKQLNENEVVTVDADNEIEPADADAPLPEEWHQLTESEEEPHDREHEDASLKALGVAGAYSGRARFITPDRVIDDSEWDDAHILS